MDMTRRDLCRASGVNIATLRHYVDLDLVHAKDRTEGGYGLYSELDVLRVLNVRRSRSFGASLQEASQLIKATDITGYVDWVHTCVLDIERQNTVRRMLLRSLAAFEDATRDILNKYGHPYLATNEGVTLSAFYDGSRRSADQVAAITDMLPYSFVCIRVPRDPAAGGVPFDVGVSLPEYGQVGFDPGLVDGLVASPGLRVYFPVYIEDVTKLSLDDFDMLLDYVDRHRFTPVGDIMCSVMHLHDEGDRLEALLLACQCIDD